MTKCATRTQVPPQLTYSPAWFFEECLHKEE